MSGCNSNESIKECAPCEEKIINNEIEIIKFVCSDGSIKTKSEDCISEALSPNLWSKTSGYTVEDCNIICSEVYDLQIQVGICQNNCDFIYGKPSDSLDRYVNKIKEIKNNRDNN